MKKLALVATTATLLAACFFVAWVVAYENARAIHAWENQQREVTKLCLSNYANLKEIATSCIDELDRCVSVRKAR